MAWCTGCDGSDRPNYIEISISLLYFYTLSIYFTLSLLTPLYYLLHTNAQVFTRRMNSQSFLQQAIDSHMGEGRRERGEGREGRGERGEGRGERGEGREVEKIRYESREFSIAVPCMWDFSGPSST